jgi:hypothetical protein
MSMNQEQTMQMYQNQQPIQTPSGSIGSMSNTAPGVQNMVTAPASNSQVKMCWKFKNGTEEINLNIF